jgi:hypothetical protein
MAGPHGLTDASGMEIALPYPHHPARASTILARHKTLAAILLALAIFATVYGFAATLSVGTSPLAAGNASVASCQDTGSPTGNYSIAYNPALGGYSVAGITVHNLDGACATKAVSVTLTGAANAVLATVTGVVPAGGGTLTLSPLATVAAANVTGVSVGING